MKRVKSALLGVTLLEIMLVLAIAAMIIVMSVRYYQSAISSQQGNTILTQIQAIAAAADNYAQYSNGYTGLDKSLASLLPANTLTAPWGSAISITVATGSSYTIKIAGVPSAVCPGLVGRLNANNHFTNVTPCGATGATDVSYTYLSNP